MFCNTPFIGSTMKCLDPQLQSKLGFRASDTGEIIKATRSVLENIKDYSQLRELVLPLYSWKAISTKTEEDYRNLLRTMEGSIN